MKDSHESMTAKICSFARAYHSNYGKEKIFDDYLAYDLMGKDEYEKIGQLIERDFDLSRYDPNYSFCRDRIREKMDAFILPIPLSRIAFAEQELARFAAENGKCQYVICGAGMDTFAFRNENPEIQIFELDHPNTQRYKLNRIRALEWNIPKNVRYVPIDFSKDDMTEQLTESGFNPSIPAFFSILGVTYYLTLPVFEQTIEKIGSISALKSKVVFDYPDETTFQSDGVERVWRLPKITERLGEPMQHGYTLAEIESALNRHGFLIDRHETPKTIQKRFFEGRSDSQRAFENIHFILAVKKGGDMHAEL